MSAADDIEKAEPKHRSSVIDLQSLNGWMLWIAILAQVLTVVITWQLWQVREAPPHLPVFDWPQLPFGFLMLGSLLVTAIWPKWGLVCHCIVIAAASLFDQFRLQPQFLAIIMLMLATLSEDGMKICRWFLASLWFWAGFHKLLSPHWFAFASHWIVNASINNPELANDIHWYVALAIALAEILAGLLAVFATRWAAVSCAAMHFSIFFLLIDIEWNYSVLPWNAATGIVGFWVMWNSRPLVTLKNRQWYRWNKLELLVAIVLFVAPAGFYRGFLDHGYASVLYSDFIPRALITKHDELEFVQGWDPIHVPFPSERRTLLKYFEQVAKEGEKLHVFDPRPSLPDFFYVVRDQQLVAISEEQFFTSALDGEVSGVGYDDRYAIFWLERWGQISRRWYRNQPSDNRHNAIAYAYTVDPQYFSIELLRLLPSLKNLEQLQLADCPIQDRHMSEISKLKGLQGIGLNNTAVTDEGLMELSELSGLRILEVENTQISPAGMKKLQSSLGLSSD